MNRDPAAWARLARALREARGHLGLTQAQVAERAGVSLYAVGAAERGDPPEKRMPPTLAKIAKALEWQPGTIENILDGAEPPGGWSEASGQVDADLLDRTMSHAMVTATDNVTAAEIRAAVTIALDELRRHGVVTTPNVVQPKATK